MSPIFYVFWTVVVVLVLMAVLLTVLKMVYGESPPNNTTYPNQSGTLAPALCCHQFGEGNEWNDERK